MKTAKTKSPKVHVSKQYEGCWMVWTETNGLAKCAEIVAFDDYFMGKVKRRFRVDVSGKTVDSLIDNFQTAKKVARKYVTAN